MRIPSLALILIPAAALAQEPADWRFAHPSATLVGGIRLGALFESPIVAAMIDEATAKDPSAAAMVGLVKTSLGQVAEMRFSLLDKGGDQMDALVMVTGKLDPQLAAALTQGKAQSRRINESTLLLGEEPSLEEAVRRLEQPPALLHNRALLRGALLAGHDFWIAGSLPDHPMTAAVKAKLRGLALGFDVTRDLVFETTLDTDSPQMAEELVRGAREAEAKQPELKGLLNASVADTSATFRVTVPKEQVIAAIREGTATQLITQMAGAQPGAIGPAVRLPPPPPKPAAPKRSTIRILGLEGGPREIPAPGVH